MRVRLGDGGLSILGSFWRPLGVPLGGHVVPKSASKTFSSSFFRGFYPSKKHQDFINFLTSLWDRLGTGLGPFWARC